jgi:integrase
VKKGDLYFGVKKAGEGKKAYLTVAQVKAILKAVEGRPIWDCFFTLLVLSGLRSNEILGLYVEDLDFDNNLIWIRRGAWNGKIQTVKTPESENVYPDDADCEGQAPGAPRRPFPPVAFPQQDRQAV